MMPTNPSTTRGVAPSRARSVVTTLLLVVLAVLIVRDILVRRWTATTRANADVTQGFQ